MNDAWHHIDEALTAVERTKEKWWEAEINRVAGEIALKPPEPNAAKAQAFFERALSVARAQQAKSWELRAAMSVARLWRDQGKRSEARDLLAPVYLAKAFWIHVTRMRIEAGEHAVDCRFDEL